MPAQDGIALLREDHRAVKQFFKAVAGVVDGRGR